MSDDKMNFLEEGLEPTADVAEVEHVEPEAVELAPETGEKPQDVPPTPAESREHFAPVTALMDEREKRQEAQRQAEAYKKELDAMRQRSQQPQPKPDFYDDPDKALDHRINGVKLQQSKFFAEKEFGADLVQEAYAYFDQHPNESRDLMNHPSPFHAAVEHYKRQKFLSEVNDPDQWRKSEAERIRAEVMAEIAAGSTSRPNAPPPSMASAPSAGKDAISKGSAFDQVFS